MRARQRSMLVHHSAVSAFSRLLGLRPPQPHHVFQHVADIAENADVGVDVLVDRRRIDVDVDLLRIRRKRIETAGDAVVETRADADHDVAIVHRHVGFIGAVHAQHAQPVLARCRIGAEAHQRRGDREVREFDQFAQQLVASGPELMTPPPE